MFCKIRIILQAAKVFDWAKVFFVFVVSSSKKNFANSQQKMLLSDYQQTIQTYYSRRKQAFFYIFFQENLESHSQPKVLSTGQPSCSVKIFCYDFDIENDLEFRYILAYFSHLFQVLLIYLLVILIDSMAPT